MPKSGNTVSGKHILLSVLPFLLPVFMSFGHAASADSDPRLLDFVDSFRADPYGFRHSFFKGKEPAYSMPDSNSLMVEYEGISNKVEVHYTILYSGNRILAYNLSIRSGNKELDSLLYKLYLATPNGMYYHDPGYYGISCYDETVFTDVRAACFRGSEGMTLPDSTDHAILYMCSYFSGMDFGMGGTIGAYDLKNYMMVLNMYRYISSEQYILLLHATNLTTRVNAALVYLQNRRQFPKSLRKGLDERIKVMKRSDEKIKVHHAGCIRMPPGDMAVRTILKHYKNYP